MIGHREAMFVSIVAALVAGLVLGLTFPRERPEPRVITEVRYHMSPIMQRPDTMDWLDRTARGVSAQCLMVDGACAQARRTNWCEP